MKEAKKIFFEYLCEQWAFVLLAIFAISWVIYKHYIDDVSRYVEKMVGLIIFVFIYLFIQLIIKVKKDGKKN